MFAWIEIVNERFLSITPAIFALMNCLLYVDLYWIMKDPFLPQKKRIALYVTLTISLIIIIILWELIVISSSHTSNLHRYGPPILGLIINCSTALLSLYFMIAIVFRIMKKGTSAKLRQIITIRYILLYALFLF